MENPYKMAQNLFTSKGKEQKQKEEDDQKLAETVETRYLNSRQDKVEISIKWGRFVDLYEGRHWQGQTQKWKSRAVENMIFSLIESMLPLMTDRSPEILIEAVEDNDISIAYKLNQVVSYIWEQDRMQEKLVEIIRNQLMLGTGILKVCYNPDLLNGAGQIESHVVDPFDFYPDSYCTNPDNMRYCTWKTRKSIEELVDEWGDKAKTIPSNAQYDETDMRPTFTRARKNETEIADVLEHWYKKKKEIWVATVSNGVLLDNRKSPYEKDSFPFVMFYDHKLTGEFWGVSEVENLEPLQRELNKIRSIIMDNMIASSNTIITLPKTSGVKKSSISNEPGLIIEHNPGSPPGRLEPVQVAPFVINMYENTKKGMEEVTGVYDVTKGVMSSSVTAASAISILSENSRTRVRAKMRNTEHAIRRVGEWYISHIRQFWTEPRIIRIVGKSDEHINFDAREMRQPDPRQVDENGQPLQTEDGQFMYELLSEFDVKVTAGSSMAINKSARYQQAFDMFQAGAIDIESLLNLADVGIPQEIIQKLIKYGALKDPEQPQIDPSEMLKGLGLRFTATTNDVTLIQQAIDGYMAQYQQVTGGAQPPEAVPPELKGLQGAPQPQGAPTGAPMDPQEQMPPM